LQFEKPVAHVPPHDPFVQVTLDMFAELQTFPHEPQLFGSVDMATSQPSVCLFPLQSAKPVLQAPLHNPPVHAGDIWLLLQTAPQEPQLATSVLIATSQPSAEFRLQFAKPTLQVDTVQDPEVQEAVACAREQTFPQVPQLFTSVFELISHPFARIPSQFLNPVLQVPNVHTLAVHVPLAFGYEHMFPHVPQLFAFVVILISHPSFRTKLQSAKPVLQDAITHAPPVHPGVAFGYGPQTLPQPPQFVVVEKYAQTVLSVH